MPSRTAKITTGETKGQRACRAETVARMQASAMGRRVYYEPDEPIGIHKFAGYVGDNREGLYIYWTCGRCGRKHSCKRDQVSTLKTTQGCAQYQRQMMRDAKSRKSQAEE